MNLPLFEAEVTANLERGGMEVAAKASATLVTSVEGMIDAGG